MTESEKKRKRWTHRDWKIIIQRITKKIKRRKSGKKNTHNQKNIKKKKKARTDKAKHTKQWEKVKWKMGHQSNADEYNGWGAADTHTIRDRAQNSLDRFCHLFCHLFLSNVFCGLRVPLYSLQLPWGGGEGRQVWGGRAEGRIGVEWKGNSSGRDKRNKKGVILWEWEGRG